MMSNYKMTATTPKQIVDSIVLIALLDTLSRDYRCNLSIDIVSGSKAGHKWGLMTILIAICL